MIGSLSKVALSGGILVAGVAWFQGCGVESDSGEYHEFSSVKDNGVCCAAPMPPRPEPEYETPVSDDAVQPAVAEKSDAPAIAQVSAVRVENKVPASAADSVANNDPTPIAKPKPGGMQLLIAENSFKKEGDALRVSYDDLDLLKVLNITTATEDVTDHFPAWLENLDGKTIRIRGFMYPPFQDTGLKGFVLARDNQICCFGRDPKIYDLIHVAMKSGTTTDYIPNRPFDVVGTFHIRPESSDGLMLGLYELSGAEVITGRSR